MENNTLSNKPLRLTGEYLQVQGYGYKHRGIDYGQTVTNQVITATVDMTIEYIGLDSKTAKNGGFGYYIRGRAKDGTYHYFGHLKANSSKVASGQVVKQNTPLAIMGSTGNSTGIHIHYEVRKNKLSSSHINPNTYLTMKKPEQSDGVKRIKKLNNKFFDSLSGIQYQIAMEIEGLDKNDPHRANLMKLQDKIKVTRELFSWNYEVRKEIGK